MTKCKYIFLLSCIISNLEINAQIELSRDVIGSAGLSSSTENIHISHTIGEPLTLRLENSSIHTMGFQQPDAMPISEFPFAVPGGISPNGDNVNDSWLPMGFENYPNATVKVFDRWGQEVFYANSEMAPWDGRLDGKELPIADYYYIIDLGNGQQYHGVVTLKK
ncbi:MAG: gliding motility-associated C-terminal domain-containing protein [Crocinitomicaceae bacterium]|nr:gliding motility-associated C-terminal domain-containing protein [Crocinitomicaceae bacterium]